MGMEAAAPLTWATCDKKHIGCNERWSQKVEIVRNIGTSKKI